MLTLRTASLDWALAHATTCGDTDVFPTPFEFRAITHDWTSLRSFLAAQDVLGWPVRPHRSLLAPKAKYGFRNVTQLDPLDFLITAALVFEIANDLEVNRVPPSHDIVFSYRALPTSSGQLFDPSIGYGRFATTSKKLSQAFPFVAITDIADFYPRIYHHRLENALAAATTKSSHVHALMKLLSGWNGAESYGIPVGSAPMRLLAETALSDVDQYLPAHGVRFVRFNDDYRLFAASYAEAYRYLALLADILNRNHGLTLQPHKTNIMATSDFSRRYLTSIRHKELAALQSQFEEILEELGISDPYETINFNKLTAKQKRLVQGLNLVSLFEEAMGAGGESNYGVIRFVLLRMGQLQDDSLVDIVLRNLDSLHPAFYHIISYIGALTSLSSQRKQAIGNKLLSLIDGSILSELEYHQMWALDLFANSVGWGPTKDFPMRLDRARGAFARRKIILAMGRGGQRHWFQSQWRTSFDLPHWPRRAFLWGASCLPGDASKHMYKSIGPRLDPLEAAVVKWARVEPIC